MIEVLLDSLWQGAIVVVIAAAITFVVPQRHAATRYAVWFAAMIALALVPVTGEFSLGESTSAIPSSVIHATRVASDTTEQAAAANSPWLAALWIAGVALCLVRLMLSYVRVARIVRSATPAPALGERVLLSTAISVPIAAGLLRPFVIVPKELAYACDPVDLQTIVAHEIAHIERKDIVGNLIQRLFESLLFFNPWVYVIGRQMVKERESACDDRAISAANDPQRYASCLASLALRSPRVPSPLLTPSAIGSGRMLVDRIARLLNGKVAQVKTNYVVVTAAVALFALFAFVLQVPRGSASTGGANCTSDVQIVNAVAPEIPSTVLKRHGPGEVTDLVTVTAHGHVSDVKMMKSSGNVTIDDAVAHAAAHSTYKPEVRNCKAVSGGQYLFHADFSPSP